MGHSAWAPALAPAALCLLLLAVPTHAAGRILASGADQAGSPALGPAAAPAALSDSGCSSGGSGGATSSLWGACGELWDPSGPLLDFSFAGYRQGAAPLPSPPATRSVLEFRQAGMDDTAMLQAALAWANSQPLTEDYIVLSLPAGEYTLTAPLAITRSRVVLRGAGTGDSATVLSIPQSLTDLLGPNPGYPRTGGYVANGAFVSVTSNATLGKRLGRVACSAKRGDDAVEVDDVAGLVAGEFFDLWFTDIDGRFNALMYNDTLQPPEKYVNDTRVKLSTRILAVDDQRVTLERRLPYDIAPGLNSAQFYARQDTVYYSGVEGLVFSFKWALYAGHHLEKGYNAVEFYNVYDCWVRDIASINADSTVVMTAATGITVSGVRIEVTKSRANNIPNAFNEPANRDGHWGVHHGRSFDLLAEGVDVRCSLFHDVGTDSSSKFGVFQDSVMVEGNLDLHRALAGPTLYTNISAGRAPYNLRSGGPPPSGPNAAYGTTWWHITTDGPIYPPHTSLKNLDGLCEFGGPLLLVGVDLIPNEAAKMCPTWFYEKGVDTPPNLYAAQLARRRALMAAAEAAAAAAGVGPSVGSTLVAGPAGAPA